MNGYEDRLKNYINDNELSAEHLVFTQSCHSVAEAAEAVNGKPEDFVKNVCYVNPNGELVVAIVKGEHRVDKTKLLKEVGLDKLRMANADEVLEKTGYPAGGTPSFGYDANFLIDKAVMRNEFIYSGGGSEYSLIKLNPHVLQTANKGRIVSIVE